MSESRGAGGGAGGHEHNFQFVKYNTPYYASIGHLWVRASYLFICVCGQEKLVYSKKEPDGWHEVK